jgi:hypothetical protein
MKRGPKFVIDPNPPVAGQPATITYTGNATEITYQVGGRPEVKCKVPPKEIPIDPVPSGEQIFVDDGTGPPDGEADWPIVENMEALDSRQEGQGENP